MPEHENIISKTQLASQQLNLARRTLADVAAKVSYYLSEGSIVPKELVDELSAHVIAERTSAEHLRELLRKGEF